MYSGNGQWSKIALEIGMEPWYNWRQQSAENTEQKGEIIMRRKTLFAGILSIALLLSGCAVPSNQTDSLSSTGSPAGETDTSHPESRLEQISAQIQQWENDETIDKSSYQCLLEEVLELTGTENRNAYATEDGNAMRLDQEKQDALRDAAMRCHYTYSIFVDFDPFSQEDIAATIAMLVLYTPGSLDAHWVESSSPATGMYLYVEKDKLQSFLDDALAPAGEAYRKYKDHQAEWGWYDDEDGVGLCVNVSGYTSTLPYCVPFPETIRPLGGNRYLVVCDMTDTIGIDDYQLAFVAEDTALPNEPPHVRALDCLSTSWVNEVQELTPDKLEEFGDQYKIEDDSESEIITLWERLEALSPIPFHTNLPISDATNQALIEAMEADEEYHGGTFEDYVAALRVNATMHRYSMNDAWEPANSEYGGTYAEWNLIPAKELEEASMRRFGIDLATNNRVWLDDREFVPIEYDSEKPMAEYDGENYIVYMNGRGGLVGDPQVSSLTYNYDGTYTAVFTEDFSDFGAGVNQVSLHLRNVGTEDSPFFQVLGYSLPG